MSLDLFDISGKVALVTGGRRGIGLTLAIALKKAGAKVAVVAKSEDRGDLPKDIFYFNADLALRSERSQVIQKVLDNFGCLNILVNNAGIIRNQSVFESKSDTWEELIAVNLTAVFELSQAAARVMRRGKIIQIGSISSFTGARNLVGYSTAKHGLIGMIKCLSNELMPLGINVNGIAPGFIDTEMQISLTSDPKRFEEIIGRVPAGRMGAPRDLVGALIYLASDASNYVSGTSILIDGGWCGR